MPTQSIVTLITSGKNFNKAVVSVQWYFDICLGVNPNCIDDGTVESITIQTYDGQNWEQAIDQELQKEDGGIKKLSKAE